MADDPQQSTGEPPPAVPQASAETTPVSETPRVAANPTEPLVMADDPFSDD